MTAEERRALLGDLTIQQIHQDVDTALDDYGIPAEAIAQMRLVFGPVVRRLDDITPVPQAA